VTYPNLLVLDYLRTNDVADPELQMQAEKYVSTGYQRLLTFEVRGGGFSLFGRAPAEVFLSAYGLMQLADMAEVYPVDEAVIERTAQWLLAQHQSGGTWQAAGDSRAGGGKLGTTAYVTWALVEAGYEDTPEVSGAVAYLRAETASVEDAYTLALAANALAAYAPDDSATKSALDHLYEQRVVEGDTVYWKMGGASFMGAMGQSGAVETTALAAYALMRAEAHPDAVNGAMSYLLQAKDAWGTWSTTQATILSLKALLLASESGGKAAGPATLLVSLNGEQVQEFTIDEANADVVHVVTFDRGLTPGGSNRVEMGLFGGGNLMYQVTTRTYLPWHQIPPAAQDGEAMTIDLAYDRTDLAMNDEVTVSVEVRLNREGILKLGLVDLGVPPGFTVLAEDLSRFVEVGTIARYEVTGRQIIVYVEDLTSGVPLRFQYRLRARFPMRAQTPASMAYDYYNPAQPAVQAPQWVMVE
jgi:uncharacterized protein YfaS (alpha-2-macroglobulin family)